MYSEEQYHIALDFGISETQTAPVQMTQQKRDIAGRQIYLLEIYTWRKSIPGKAQLY